MTPDRPLKSLMENKPIRVLLIEDNERDVLLLREALAVAKPADLEVGLAHASRLSEGLAQIEQDSFDVLLLDLSLPDGQGLETYFRARRQAPQMPIVVLTGLQDDAVALRAIREGAQDYIVKGEYQGTPLVRALRYAIERHKLQTAFPHQFLMDELTALYNRRGFEMLGEQESKVARRESKPFVVIFGDVVGMKALNVKYGYPEGDRLLAQVAQVFRRTFRDADILARVGGDEFAALAIGSPAENVAAIFGRLQEALQAARTGSRYEFDLDVGMAPFQYQQPIPVRELLRQAEQAARSRNPSDPNPSRNRPPH